MTRGGGRAATGAPIGCRRPPPTPPLPCTAATVRGGGLVHAAQLGTRWGAGRGRGWGRAPFDSSAPLGGGGGGVPHHPPLPPWTHPAPLKYPAKIFSGHSADQKFSPGIRPIKNFLRAFGRSKIFSSRLTWIFLVDFAVGGRGGFSFLPPLLQTASGSTVFHQRRIAWDPEFSLTTQHPLWGGGGGGADNPPPPSDPPPLSDWAIFSPGLRPIKKIFWRLRRKSV